MQDPNAPGSWRYQAHLSVLIGIDVNVSNVTVASHDAGRDVRVTRLERDEPQKASDRKRAKSGAVPAVQAPGKACASSRGGGLTHGTQLVIEDTSIAAWAKTWGGALAAFSPGMLVTGRSRRRLRCAGLVHGPRRARQSALGAGGPRRGRRRARRHSPRTPIFV